MRKKNLSLPALYIFSALVVITPVIVQASEPKSVTTSPSQEFWDYLTEFGDDNGDVLDPLEYDQMLSMKESEDKNSNSALAERELETPDNPKVRNADMKFETKSSAQASSSAVKGATL